MILMSAETTTDHIASLFNHATWSDLTLELANGEAIRVHKNILSIANGYFESLCKSLNLSSVSSSSDT